MAGAWVSMAAGLDAVEVPQAAATIPNLPAGSSFSPARSKSSVFDSGRVMPKRIYFPPDPPPLDARINFDAARTLLTGTPDELAAYVNEPFYAPLSTCLTDLSETVRERFRPRLSEYQEQRDTLLKDLRALIARLDGATAEERFAGFTELAQRQAPALRQLEAEADKLRADLARLASWYSLREWKIGRGRLKDRLPEHRVLEFELVRAAAFYQEGLVPAQRRLLREAAMLMQDAMFAEVDTSGGRTPLPPPLVFFSPDLVRVLSADQFPGPVAVMLQDYAAEKDALRRELVATIIEQDRVVFSSARRDVLEKFAGQQTPRLEALEARAEALRQAYAPMFSQRREAAPPSLSPELEEKIHDFEHIVRRLKTILTVRQARLLARLRVELSEVDPAEHADRKGAAQQQLATAFEEEHQPELVRLKTLVKEIHPQLVALSDPADVDLLATPSDAFLIDFMREYRSDWADYEYSIAVFEPGLSAAQRRLLVGGALARLELPLPGAARQAGAMPYYLFNGRGE